MERRQLGNSDLRVSAVGLGGNTFGRTCDAARTAAIVHRALQLGVNFIDTADASSDGRSEELLGAALRGHRDEVVLCTKTGWPRPGADAGGMLHPKRIAASLEASLRRLGTDHIDVYYFHRPDPSTPIEESLVAAGELVRAGKVRYVACSNYPAWQVAEMTAKAGARGFDGPVASQVGFNLIDRSAEAEMIPACEHFGLSIIPYSPLASGFLTGKYRPGSSLPQGTRLQQNEPARERLLTGANFEKLGRYEAFAAERGRSVGELAIAWLLAHRVVGSVISGATATEQVEANVAASDWTISAEDLAALQ